MAAQWFCQMAGAEVGPLSSQQVKMMVASGRLLPGDSIRQGASGPWIPAARVKGLFPAVQSPSRPSAGDPSPAAKNGRSLPMAQKATPAKPAAKPGKKPAGGQPGTVRTAKAIVVPARQAQQAAPVQESADDDFPEELAGGIPKPKKGFNFDRLAIDTTPVKVTGRKNSRVGGMNKAERTKVMRIMAGAIGGALLLSAIMMAIHFLGHHDAPKPQPAATASNPQDSHAGGSSATAAATAKTDAKDVAAASDKSAAKPGKSAPGANSGDAAGHPESSKSKASTKTDRKSGG
jgi:hypothetical protein